MTHTNMKNETLIKHSSITQSELMRHLSYDPITGIFTRKLHISKIHHVGAIAGNLRKDGYIQIKINLKLYLAHRLAWIYIHGYLPEKFIDHINGNRSDNKLSNLREATREQNNWNRCIPRNNNTGFQGVSFYKPYKKYVASASINNKKKFLGYFETAEQASKIYLDFINLHRGKFINRSTCNE